MIKLGIRPIVLCNHGVCVLDLVSKVRSCLRSPRLPAMALAPRLVCRSLEGVLRFTRVSTAMFVSNKKTAAKDENFLELAYLLLGLTFEPKLVSRNCFSAASTSEDDNDEHRIEADVGRLHSAFENRDDVLSFPLFSYEDESCRFLRLREGQYSSTLLAQVQDVQLCARCFDLGSRDLSVCPLQ